MQKKSQMYMKINNKNNINKKNNKNTKITIKMQFK